MKPSYKGFEAKQNTGNYITLPPVGAYEAEIQAVRFTPKNEDENIFRDTIELMIEITEGEYANRYHEVYENQKERFGDSIKYKGIFKLYPPVEGEESYDWRKSVFEGNLWAVSESNGKNADGSYKYNWDWDEKKLKGKKVGINVREYLYTYNGKERSTTEIGRFETIQDVRDGKCRTLKPRDKRKDKDESDEEASTDGSGFTDVSSEVSVPW